MKLISEKSQLEDNLKVVENYLTEGTEEEQKVISELISRGSCLVAYHINNEIRFAPSRFIGYVNNSIKSHKSGDIDGRETNVVISKILSSKPTYDDDLRKTFLNYCKNLGIKANNKKHKFWSFEITEEFENNKTLTGDFPEGKIVERKHLAKERNSKVILIAKQNFKINNNGKLYCEVCNFDFEITYGELGKDFIEGHHTIPVSEMETDHKTKPEDIAMLCSNCHRMIHKKRPWLSIKELKEILKK